MVGRLHEMEIARRRADRVVPEQSLQGVEIDFQFETDDPGILQALVEQPLAEIGPLDATLSLSDQDGSLGIEGRAHAEALGGQLSVDAEGGFDDLGLVDELDVKLVARARDLSAIGAVMGLEQARGPA